MKKVGAVVLNWNGPDDTIKCVHSLRESGYPELDVVVVDNASTDDSLARFAGEIPNERVIACASNGGYAAGNNAGIKEALARGAEYVLVINNDVLVTKGFLEPMLAEAVSDAGVGIVTCDARFQSDPSRTYPTGGRISLLRAAGVKLSRRDRGRRAVVDFVSGCILLVRREVFEKVGLFDERFFMYAEDVEFSRRAGAAFRFVYTPNAVVYHRSGGGDRWSKQTPTYLYYMSRNRFIVFRDEPAAYRIYLALMVLGVAVAKSVSIAAGKLATPSSGQVREQLSALWGGWIAGLRSAALN